MIGIQLGIPCHKLEEFKNEHDPLSVIIDYWLKGNIKDVKVSWEVLISILRVDEPGLAERVSKENCTGKITTPRGGNFHIDNVQTPASRVKRKLSNQRS